MDTNIFMTIALAIISIAGALVSAFVIPWIKTNVSAKDLETIIFWVRFAVRCADQLFTPDQWAEKKKYVMAYIIEKAGEIGINLTEEDIDVLIEACVNQIHHGGDNNVG
jgi:hypothetical protein